MRKAGFRGAFWPTPTQEELLRITVGAIDHSASRWQAIQPLDIRALEEGSFGLLPLLHERLEVIAPDDPTLPLLRGIYRSTWYRNQLLLERLGTLLASLRAHCIEPLLVGGAAALLRWYSGAGSRPVPLVELIVAPDRGELVREVAISTGWRPAGRTHLRRRFVDTEGRTLAVHEGVPPQVAGPLSPTQAFEAMSALAQPSHICSEAALLLAPTDELVFLCGDGARTILPPTIQWLLDVANLLGAQDRPDPLEVVARGRLFHLVEPLRDAVIYLSDHCFVTGLGEYIEPLVAEPVQLRDAVVYRLTGSSVGRLGGLPTTVAAHLRATSGEAVLRSLWGVPAYLAETWGADSVRRLPATAAKKFRRLEQRRKAQTR